MCLNSYFTQVSPQHEPVSSCFTGSDSQSDAASVGKLNFSRWYCWLFDGRLNGSVWLVIVDNSISLFLSTLCNFKPFYLLSKWNLERNKENQSSRQAITAYFYGNEMSCPLKRPVMVVDLQSEQTLLLSFKCWIMVLVERFGAFQSRVNAVCMGIMLLFLAL